MADLTKISQVDWIRAQNAWNAILGSKELTQLSQSFQSHIKTIDTAIFRTKSSSNINDDLDLTTISTQDVSQMMDEIEIDSFLSHLTKNEKNIANQNEMVLETLVWFMFFIYVLLVYTKYYII